MSFREKSAWAMGALMLLTGLFYLQIALRHTEPGSTEVHDLVHWVIVVIIGLVLAGVKLGIAPVWLAIGALILLGIGMLTGVSRTRSRERPPSEL